MFKTIKLLNDEKGAFFVFGPWWFVILIMVIGFIFSMLRKNNVKNKGSNRVNDYEPINKLTKPLNVNNTCPKCGKNNSNVAKFCSGCGGNLVDHPGIYCPECGGMNFVNAKFCQECGKEFDNI